jgi:excisionase family DNA binding protein
MTPAELAEYLNTTTVHLKRMRDRGNGPPSTKVGKFVRYSPAAVDRWLEDNTEDGAA